MEQERWMTSVGIDIGSSTTQCIFSRLKLERRYGLSALPQYRLSGREVIYQSEIYMTPLAGETQIDDGAIEAILTAEYARAGLRPGEVDTGAVIVTGLAALKANADAIAHRLAGKAGDFVIAQAGGDLEAVLSGKGSGAESRSLQGGGAAVNIDIGGGTSNAAVFHRGNCVRTLNFHIGGRLIMVESDGLIRKVTPEAAEWLEKHAGLHLREGTAADLALLRQITDCWSEMLLRHILGPGAAEACPLLYGGVEYGNVPWKGEIEEVWISGGVGRLMEQPPPESLAEAARYGDIGPLLAQSLVCAAARYSVPVLPAPQAQQATVIGAGVHTTALSGSTVFAEEALLPLRNIPVVKAALTAGLSPADAAATVEQALTEGALRFAGSGDPLFAVVLPRLPSWSYSLIRAIAEAAASRSAVLGIPLMLFICESDIARALGNRLHLLTGGKPPVVCLDQISADYGDYIDIGASLAGECIPVAVKTLAFRH